MTRTLIDVDDASLAAAAEVLGTKTKVETVNRALSEIAARKVRLAFLDTLDEVAADFSDSELMRHAWE